MVNAFEESERLVPSRGSFKQFVRSEPFFDDLDFQVDLEPDRSREPAHEIDSEP